MAFHVTTCKDKCAEIKKNGLHNLQWVLSNDTALCKFLKENNISFDIESKLMFVNGIAYDVDYSPKAYYFQQAQNGLYARQAILCDVLGITLQDIL